MADVAELIRDELDTLAPPGESSPLGWDDVVRRAAPTASVRSARRGRSAVAVVVLLVAVAAPAFAFSATVRTLFGLDQPQWIPDRVVVHVISAPVGNGFYAHLWPAPSTTGCSFITLDRAPQPARTPVSKVGGVCSMRDERGRDRAAATELIRLGLSIGRRPAKGSPATWVPPVVSGSLYEGLHAVRVQVEWRGGRLPLRFDNGYFLGGSTRLYIPAFAAFPFSVVAYDMAGHEVARKKLASPALRLMSGGWKQFAREYLAWKRAHR